MTEGKLDNGTPFRAFEEIDSTNEEAKRLAAQGERGPLWLIARQQTGGHGRRGRAWVSPPGNLYCTLLIAPQCTPAEGAQLSFVAALAAAHMVSCIAGRSPVKLKWPNDLLIDGKKMGGILLESASAPGAAMLDWLAAGIGVNVTSHPEGTETPATSLKDEGIVAPPGPFDCLQFLAFGWDDWFTQWKTLGFEPIRMDWLYRAHGLNQPITARLGQESVSGVFRDLDETGALVLELADGSRRKISAGEVFF